METSRLSEHTDLSVPAELRVLRTYPDVLVHWYDYVYQDDNYSRELRLFQEEFRASEMEEMNCYCLAFSHVMKDTAFNRRKKYDFGFSGNLIVAKATNVSLDGEIVKLALFAVEGGDKSNVIPCLIDGYNKYAILVTTEKTRKIEFTESDFASSVSAQFNRHKDIIGVQLNVDHLYGFCKRNQSNIYFPYGGFDFGSFIFFEVNGT
jgi:hypothetical protein